MYVRCSCVWFWPALGRITVDLQGLVTMSRPTQGTHTQSLSQWNAANSYLKLPHRHCPLCSPRPSESMEARRRELGGIRCFVSCRRYNFFSFAVFLFSINHSSPIVSWIFMRCLHETNACATGEQCMLRSVSFVLEVATQRPPCPLQRHYLLSSHWIIQQFET